MIQTASFAFPKPEGEGITARSHQPCDRPRRRERLRSFPDAEGPVEAAGVPSLSVLDSLLVPRDRVQQAEGALSLAAFGTAFRDAFTA
jgi:hypothetical protein